MTLTGKGLTIILLTVSVLLVAGAIVSYKSDAITLILNHDEFKSDKTVLVISPIMTANAYSSGGFYDYYSGKCGQSCLTITISQNVKLKEYGSSNGVLAMKRIGYPIMNDFIIDYNLRTDPRFLDQYQTIIVLHSEYITQRLFDALESHHHVIYLYPNANYGMVSLDGIRMTLVQGHSYNNMENGFGWKYDNTDLEYDKECKSWKFIPIPNGYQLNCNPESTIGGNFELLKTLKDL